MHKTILMGGDNRISTDLKVEEKVSSAGKAFKTVSFQVACGNGSYKDASGNWKNRVADFINVRTSVPYIAEKLIKAAAKGMCIDLTGTLHTWSKKKEDGTYANGSYIELEQDDAKMVHVYTPVKPDKAVANAPEVVGATEEPAMEMPDAQVDDTVIFNEDGSDGFPWASN